jgi:hypothetical protein
MTEMWKSGMKKVTIARQWPSKMESAATTKQAMIQDVVLPLQPLLGRGFVSTFL